MSKPTWDASIAQGVLIVVLWEGREVLSKAIQISGWSFLVLSFIVTIIYIVKER
jgi:hypothetical protein